MYIDRGDLNSAARECQRMIDLDPNFWAAHQTLSIVLVKQGRYDDALVEAQKSTQLSNRSNASLWPCWDMSMPGWGGEVRLMQ